MPTITSAIDGIINTAATAATTAKNAVHAAVDAALAAAPAGPACLDGVTHLEDAWGQVALAYGAVGQIAALESLISAGGLTGLVGGIPTGILDLNASAPNAAAKLATATADRDDAKSYVLIHEPEVLAKYANCICSGLSAGAILGAQSCINANLPLLDADVLQVANPDNPAAHGSLDTVVQTLVNTAAGIALSGDCNAGVTELKKAQDLINAATAAVNDIKDCIEKLQALAPADPLLAAALPKFNAANNALTSAKNILANDTKVITTWQNRARCLLRSREITVVVRDESADQMGAGVQLAISNPVIAALNLPGIDATGILGSTICPGSAAHVTVPLAGIHLDPPAGAPPQPPSVPIVPELGVLVFNVTSPGSHPAFSAPVNAQGITTTSNPLQITLQLPDTSSITSC